MDAMDSQITNNLIICSTALLIYNKEQTKASKLCITGHLQEKLLATVDSLH